MRSKSLKGLILAAGLAAAVPLAGCVTLLPKTNPVQMYRFGYDVQKVDKIQGRPAQAIYGLQPVALAFGTVEFPQESAGDRIATVEGNQISYVADARWASPAQAMFNQAISEGFARSSENITLQARGPGPAPYRVDITVRKFETSYTHNKPVVTIVFDTRLIRMSDRTVVGQGLITSEVPVRRNDMTSIVEGYNVATVRAVDSLISFSEGTIGKAQMAAMQTVPPAPDKAPTKAPAKQKVEGL
jgi:cholesterol transport system auxiliary component